MDSQDSTAAGGGTPETRQGTSPSSVPAIARYEIRRALGSGGSADVYEAWDREIGRPVALKILKEAHALSGNIHTRFIREARVLAALHCPNIVRVHDSGEHDGRPYLILEMVEGSPLDRIMEDRPSLKELIRILERAANGVQAAHENGIIHRDLKPGNILVSKEGEPKVADFGLARLEDAHTRLTRSGNIVGTPLYMAPEQIRAHHGEISTRTDVYALGAILYEMLTGTAPHTADTAMELYDRILSDTVVPPRKRSTGVPRDLESVCCRALEKEPRHRYPSAREFGEDLRRWLRGEPVLARPPTAFRLFRQKLARRKSAVLAGTALLVLAVAIASVLTLWRRDSARQDRARTHLESGRRMTEELRLRLRDRDATPADLRALADRARAWFERALAEHPDNPDALLGIGRAWALAGLEKEARPYLDDAIARAPAFASLRLERARLDLENYEQTRHSRYGQTVDETPEAAALLRRIEDDLARVLNAAGLHEEIVYARGVLAFARGGHEEAARELKDYVSMVPNDARAHYWHGHALFHLKRLDEAAAALTRSIALEARFDPAHNDRGLVRHAKGDAEGAIADFTETLRLAPWRSGTLANRALVHSDRGELEKALADYNESIRLKPGVHMMLTNRGTIRQKLGDIAGALEDYEAALRLNPKDHMALLNRGAINLDAGDVEGALRDLSESIRIDPTHPNTYSFRANARRAAGDVDGSLQDHDEAVRLAPDNAHFRNNRGNSWWAKRDSRRAREDYLESIRLDPKLAEPHVGLAIVLTAEGNANGAIQEYTEALRLKPTRLDSWLQRASLYFNQRRFREAIADYEEILKLKPGHWDTIANRGGAKWELGDLEGAIADFLEALDVAPADWPARRAAETAVERLRKNPR